MVREQLAGVILAGGRSSRMGDGDKCLKPLGGKPILAHVIERLKPQVGRLAINANGDPARFGAFALPVIPDATAGSLGPAGILAALDWASRAGSFTHVLTAAADTPFFPHDLAPRPSASLRQERQVAVAASAGRPHPVFALWPQALRDDLAAFIAQGRSLKVMEFAARHSAVQVDFPLSAFGGSAFDPFFNINTPGDLAMAQRIWTEEQS
jgi:molybdopterin-guanine dinucleotide biosynthesis protein A